MIHRDILGTVHDVQLVRTRRTDATASGTVLAAVGAPGTSPATADGVARRAVAELRANGTLDGRTSFVACGAIFGASVAMIAAAERRACIVIVDDGVPAERRNRISALGGEVRVLPLHGGDEDLALAARRVVAETPGAVLVEKRATPGRGERELAEWLMSATGDALHAVVGTERETAVLDAIRKALAAEGSAAQVVTLAFDGVTWSGRAPTGTLLVSERDALETARRVAADEGLLADAARGGAALAAATRIARDAAPGALVVAFVPAADTGDLLTAYDPAWWAAHHGNDDNALTARDVLARKDDPAGRLVTLAHDATVAHAIRIMRDLEVSQIPVIQGDRIVGTIREDQVIDLLLHANDRKDGPVGAVMEDPLPEIDEGASVDELQTLLVRGGSAVIVRREDGARDILTKYDLIHALARA